MMTKTKKAVAAILILLGALAASGAAWAQTYWFTLVNQSGYTINEMYVKPVKGGQWSGDVLGQDQLLTDQFVDVTWSGGKPPTPFDVHITYEDGETAEIKGLSPPNEHSSLYIYWDETTAARWE